MKTLACAAARRRLHAFHDEELSVSEQIAVSAHLEWCEACADVLADLKAVGSLVRSTARERAASGAGELDARTFHQSVVSRFRAEEGESLSSRLQDMFADMRLVYAGLGASVGAVACILLMLNMMRFVKEAQQPGSLAAIVDTMALAETQPEPIRPSPLNVDARLLLSEATGDAFGAESDAEIPFAVGTPEFVLQFAVTKEGRVADPEVVRTSTGRPVNGDEMKAFRKLVGAVTKARYEPARVNGLPVAVNKVWPVAAITVHASKAPAERPSSPDAKGRITLHDQAAAIRTV